MNLLDLVRISVKVSKLMSAILGLGALIKLSVFQVRSVSFRTNLN